MVPENIVFVTLLTSHFCKKNSVEKLQEQNNELL